MNTTYRVLVVDDEQFYAHALSLYLEEQGLETTRAFNGLEAIIELQRQHFDLILLDVNMPGLDGYDICAAIKADPQFSETPIMFLTSEDDPASRCTRMEVGACDYISKGERKELLLEHILAQLQ